MHAYDRELKEYDDCGYTVVRGLFSPERLSEVRREISNFIANEAPGLNGRDINYVDKDRKIVNSIHKMDIRPNTYFYDLLHSEEMEKIAGVFLKDKAIGRRSELFAKPPKSGLPSPPHQDNYYWCLQPLQPGTALTIWIALESSDETNGAVNYLKGSHRIGVLDHVDSFAPGSSQTIKDKNRLEQFEKVCIHLSPGDALIHDAMTVHWSERNESDRGRMGLTMQFQAARAKEDPVMKKHYEDRLMMQVKMREEARLREMAAAGKHV